MKKSLFVFLVLFNFLSIASLQASPKYKLVDSFQNTTGSVSGINVNSMGSMYAIGSRLKNGLSVWVVRKSSNFGKTWKTVDEFEFTAGKSSTGASVAVAESGVVYAVGHSFDQNDQMVGIVRKSTDFGKTWKTIEQYAHFAGGANLAYKTAVDRNGRVYVLHQSQNSLDPAEVTQWVWVLRASFDFGKSWKTVDLHEKADGLGLFVDKKNQVYVGGCALDTDVPQIYDADHSIIVKRSSNFGKTWKVLDMTRVDNSQTGLINITVDSSGNIFTAGNGFDPNWNRWSLVRRSGDKGKTWTTVDRYRDSDQYNSETYQVIEGKGKKLFSIGYTFDPSGLAHLVVRKSNDAGKTWSPYLDYTGEAGGGARPHHIARTRDGRLFLGGSEVVGASREWRILEILQ